MSINFLERHLELAQYFFLKEQSAMIWSEDHLRLLITARIWRMTESNVPLCPPLGGGGGYHHPADGGYLIPRSRWGQGVGTPFAGPGGGGGPPSQVQV